jgi:glucose-6-phosphate isomerase
VTEPLTVTTSSSYDEVVQTLVDDAVASQIAAQNPTLWGAEAESEAAQRLSWVDLPTSSRPLLAEIDALRAAFLAEGVDRVVLCGMGGSSLAPEVITRTYAAALEILDSTNPSVISRALGQDLRRTAVVVSSKSGSTLETDSQRRVFAHAFEAAGIDAASRFVVVTDPGSQLEELANQEGYRKVFRADPHVGGRYSALTAFGLVPSGLAGVDVADLLDSAEDAMVDVQSDDPDNPALVLGAALASDRNRDKVALCDTGSGITGFADWAEQLIAESTGKQGSGLLPVALEGLEAPEVGRPADDVTVAFLASGAGAASFAGDKPTVTVTGSLGAQFLAWETATAVAGRLLGINPFDQPDVESAKQAARGLLDERPAPDEPVLVDSGVEVRGVADLLAGAATVDQAVGSLLSQLAEDGYLAVMAYLDAERDARLHEVRAALSRRTGRPVTFGWGPRFLHSTGQYHKGGPAKGVFMQITSTEPEDVEIPGRPFTFGQLIAAQAAGDARVLADHGRPVLRLHLQDPTVGVDRLVEVLR